MRKLMHCEKVCKSRKIGVISRKKSEIGIRGRSVEKNNTSTINANINITRLITLPIKKKDHLLFFLNLNLLCGEQDT